MKRILLVMLVLICFTCCVKQKDNTKIVNNELLKEIIKFTEELEAYPESRDSYNITVNVRKKENGIYKIWVVNSIPVTGCENLVGDALINKYKVFFVIEADYSLFIERDNNYKCNIQSPDPEDLSGMHYFEGFYEYDGKAIKLKPMPRESH